MSSWEPAAGVIGVGLDLLSGEEEAALSFRGATIGLDVAGPILVIDIGGGSTEFIVGTDRPEGLISLDVGCVRMTEQYLVSDPPTAEELSLAVSAMRDLLADVDQRGARRATGEDLGWCRRNGDDRGRSRARSHGVRPRPHPSLSIKSRSGRRCVRTLALEPIAARQHNPGLEAGRVDVIVGGALVLVSILRISTSMRFSSRSPTSSTVWSVLWREATSGLFPMETESNSPPIGCLGPVLGGGLRLLPHDFCRQWMHGTQ